MEHPTSAQQVFCFPASFAQRGLWLLDQLVPNTAAYNISLVLRIRGELDVESFQRSLRKVVQRHESLRTRFVFRNSEPQQIIEEHSALDIPFHDLTAISEATRKSASETRIAELILRPFDLSRAPLLRVALLKVEEQHYIWVLVMHHIISDGWSLSVFLRELSLIYAAFSIGEPCPLAELPIQYADFTMWQRDWLTGETLQAQTQYWKQQLQGLQILELPTDYVRPPAQSYRGATVTFDLPASLGKELQAFSLRQRCTLYMTLLAAFKLLLHLLTGQRDITIGTPVAGRTQAETEQLIGCFTNILVLRNLISTDWTFVEFLQHVKEVTLGAYLNQEMPFVKVVELLAPPRSLNRASLVRVLFALQNMPSSDARLGPATVETIGVENDVARFDLSLIITQSGSELHGLLQHSTDLYVQDTAIAWSRQFQSLIERLLNDPHQAISTIASAYQVNGAQLAGKHWQAASRTEEDGMSSAATNGPMKATPDSMTNVKNLRPESNRLDYCSEKNETYSSMVTIPGHQIEQRLAVIWAETLQLEQAGIYDNFFAIGGNSLLAAQVAYRLTNELDVKVSMREIFEAQTIAKLAEIVAQLLRARSIVS